MSSPTAPEPAPKHNNYPPTWDVVIADMQARKIFGFEKYQTHLQAFNGRNSLWDAYQEALDLVVYLRNQIIEDQARAEEELVRHSTKYRDDSDIARLVE